MNVNWADATLTTSTGSAQLLSERNAVVGFLSLTDPVTGEYFQYTKTGSPYGLPVSFSENGTDVKVGWGSVSANSNGQSLDAQAYHAWYGFVEMAPHSVATYNVPYTYSADASSKGDLASLTVAFLEVRGPYKESEYGWRIGTGNEYLDLVSQPGLYQYSTDSLGADAGQKRSGEGIISLALENPSDFEVRMGLSAALHADIYSAPSPVPEPETYSMVMAGLGAVGLLARRRMKTNQSFPKKHSLT